MRRVLIEAKHLAYRTGLRGYCFQHDTLRWAWTHRRCCADAHREAALIWRRARGRGDM